MDAIFKGVFDNELTQVIEVGDFLLCLGISLVLGLIMAAAYMWRNEHTKSFLVTLALLPAVVCVVIMMVNGNIGAGVAVAGAFSLVRFRSAPGSAKEIVTIFLAMGAGLIAGMGYLGFAALFTVIMCVMFLIYNAMAGNARSEAVNKTIKITIPEDLDYTGALRKRTRLNAPATATPAPILPFTIIMTTHTTAGRSASVTRKLFVCSFLNI